MIKKICIWVYLTSMIFASGANASDIELKNLRWGWEVFDQEAQHYIPYFKQPTTDAIRFKVDLNKYRNSYLKLTLPEKHYVWIQEKLVFATSYPETKYFALDSLYNIYQVGNFYMSVYSEELDGNSITSVIINKEDEELSAF